VPGGTQKPGELSVQHPKTLDPKGELPASWQTLTQWTGSGARLIGESNVQSCVFSQRAAAANQAHLSRFIPAHD